MQLIDQVLARAEKGKNESDHTYFSDLLLVAEAMVKTVVLGMASALVDDKDRNRYRILHRLVHSDGMGDWATALDDIVSGPASQFLLDRAHGVQRELTSLNKEGSWQYDALADLKEALRLLDIEAEDLPVRSDMKRWFRYATRLRNKTRAHGAVPSSKVRGPATLLASSLTTVYANCSLFRLPWVYLYRNISGKYRVTPIAGESHFFDHLKQNSQQQLENGVYLWWDLPRKVSLLESTAEIADFFVANGNFGPKKYELLSYASGDRIDGDSSAFSTPPGTLPRSETAAMGELRVKGTCLTNSPDPSTDYVSRPTLEAPLASLLADDRRHIVTLRGKGGIGKTSLALAVLEEIYKTNRFTSVIWLSARDVDLKPSGPKPVRPDVVSPEDMGQLYAALVLSDDELNAKGFSPRAFLEEQLQSTGTGSTLFVLDNFETTQSSIEMFNWVDTYARLPNKVLITTRLREFKGDYPVDVNGMTEDESEKLVESVSNHLGIRHIIDREYIKELIRLSEGHPYVIKILLGEVAFKGKATSISKLIAGSDEVLTALFERTYSALTPCAQRAFLTLSSWSSAVPRIALEAVLLQSTQERSEVESGLDMLINYSLVEAHSATEDQQEFLALPVVAEAFGKKKLKVSPHRAAIQADVQILQMLGPSRSDDAHLGLSRKIEKLVSGIAKAVEDGGDREKYQHILDMICRNYPPGWVTVARWLSELGTPDALDEAASVLSKYLEDESDPHRSADGWKQLAAIYADRGDVFKEVHALIERVQTPDIPFADLINTAGRFNYVVGGPFPEIRADDKHGLAQRLLNALDPRINEAKADDLSRIAWVAIHLNQTARAQAYVDKGLALDAANHHCQRLDSRLKAG